MAKIIQPDNDFGPILKQILNRLDILERTNSINNAVMQSGGFAAGGAPGSYSTANSGTWADIANTGFVMTVPYTSRILYMIFATAHMTAGAGHGYVRGDIVGFDTSAGLQWQNTGASVITENGFLWYFTGQGASKPSIPAGTYTVKMQAATDSVASTIFIDQFFHQVFLLGT